jgi:elongation factor G
MMKYLDGAELTNDEIRAGLAAGVRSGQLVLVLVGSATKNIGVKQLLDAVVSLLPGPTAVERKAVSEATKEEQVLSPDQAGPLVAQVFKTLADPFVGKLTYFRVYSGSILSDSRVFNLNKGAEERLGQLFMVRGKEQIPVPAVRAGDIGAVAKLAATSTNDTLGDRGTPLVVSPIIYPEPLFSAAVFPKTKADLDRLGAGLARLVEEGDDPIRDG